MYKGVFIKDGGGGQAKADMGGRGQRQLRTGGRGQRQMRTSAKCVIFEMNFKNLNCLTLFKNYEF